MVISVLHRVGLTVGGRDEFHGLDEPVLAVPGVLPAAIRQEITVSVVGQRLVLRRGVEVAAGGRDDVRRVGAGRIDNRRDFGEGEVGAVGVVGFEREVPRHVIGRDGIALDALAVDGHNGGVGGVTAQTHRVGIDAVGV